MTTQTTPRVQPLEEPYDPEVAETLRRMMPPGVEPLKLFRTVAHNPAILERFRTIGRLHPQLRADRARSSGRS